MRLTDEQIAALAADASIHPTTDSSAWLAAEDFDWDYDGEGPNPSDVISALAAEVQDLRKAIHRLRIQAAVSDSGYVSAHDIDSITAHAIGGLHHPA